jgi:uncharacterized membrane protein
MVKNRVKNFYDLIARSFIFIAGFELFSERSSERFISGCESCYQRVEWLNEFNKKTDS